MVHFVCEPATTIDGINQWESIADGSPSPRTEFVYNMDDVAEFNAAIRYEEQDSAVAV